MKDTINSAINGLIPPLTENLSRAAQNLWDGATTLLEPGAGLINKSDHQISQNPHVFGFAFEHLQAIGFNINAALKGSDARAYQIPPDGVTLYSPDIYIDKVGQVIAEIQAKAGSAHYVEKQANSGHYVGNILTNSENAGILGTTITINIDGIESFPISQEFAQWVAGNPYLAANLMYTAATVSEIGGAGIQGATLNATINILLQSIKIVGAYCRGEQDLAQEELKQILTVALQGLKSGLIRGVAIKVIQKLMNGNAFAALGFTVGAEVIPVLIQLLNEQITLEEALNSVGPRVLASGLITTVVIVFPPVGLALLSGAVLQGIWQELTPQWQTVLIQTAKTAFETTQKNLQAGKEHLKQQSLHWLGRLSASDSQTEGC